MSKREQRRQSVAQVIRASGADVRARIQTLPEIDQSMAWACVAAGIVGAAINSSREPGQVIELVESAIQALTVTDVWEGR
jgi:galactokinase